MVTRAKTSIFRTRHPTNHTALCFSSLITTLLASTELKGFKFAAKNLVWLTIMNEKYELCKIIKLGSWSLILPTPILWALNGCSEPNIILMATLTDSRHVLSQKGYTQVPSLDYTYIFNHVMKAVIVIVPLVVTHQWPIHQLDAKNIFINVTLNENVYLKQPFGYVNPCFPNHVFHLKKIHLWSQASILCMISLVQLLSYLNWVHLQSC